MTKHAGLSLRNTRGRALIAVVVVLAAAIAAFLISEAAGNGANGEDAVTSGSFGTVTQGSLETAVAGLCEMRTDLMQGDLASARNAFYDKAHLFLHQLAAEVQDIRVDQATSLLVSKYQVESLVPAQGEPTASARGETEITALIEQVQQSAAVLGYKAPSCSE